MKSAYRFGKAFLFAPSTAADACAHPDALRAGLTVYAVLAVLQLLTSWFNPLSFLDPNAPVLPPHGLTFWLRVALWEPVLMAMSVFFTVLVTDWMSSGWLPMKTAAATLWTAIPVAMTLAYADAHATLSRKVFVALLAVWAAPAVLLSRRIPEERWRKIGAFILGMSSIQIVCLVVEYATVVPMKSIKGFYAVSGLTLLWVLVAVGVGFRRLCATSTARAVLAFLFALLVSSVVPSLAYLLDLMPKEVLKVILYV